MLHIINKSPFESNALESCLRFLQRDSAILFIENGVYAAIKGSVIASQINEITKKNPLYALKADLQARGILEKVLAKIQLIDYSEFVDLTVQYNPIQSWT